MADVSLVFNLLSADKGASAGIAKMSGTVRAANLAGAASALALKSAEASAAAWAISLGAAVSGSVGLIPGLFLGAAAAAIGLKLATGGLGAAWTALTAQQTAAGPSAASAARQHASAVNQVTSATESLARAQRDAISAQQAIADAEESAAKDLRDLTLSVAGARLDEESATLAVADAQTQLQAAQQSGNVETIEKANIAYQQSVLALSTARNKTSDLTEEQAKATAKGVEGSDVVVAARQKEADATQAVADATRQLADARANLNMGSVSGSANAAAVAMSKLSANARGLILTMKGLAPTWNNVAGIVQNNTFAGASGIIRRLSSEYLPTMTTRLGGMGSAFNGVIRTSSRMLGTKQSISDVSDILGNTNKAVRIFGTGLSAGVSGLLGLGAAGSSFLPQLLGWVTGLATEFANWVAKARASGELGKWLSTAETALHNIWIIAGNVAGSIGAIFKGGGASDGGQLLGTIAKLTGSMRDFLSSAKGQHEITVVLGDLRGILTAVMGSLSGAAGGSTMFGDAVKVANPVLHELAKHAGLIAKVLPLVAGGYALARAAQAAKIVKDIIHLPLLGASAVANWRLASAMKAQKQDMDAATLAAAKNAPATEAQALAADESAVSADAAAVSVDAQAVSMDAAAVAVEGQTVATEAATVAQTELDVAMDANPIGLVVIAIAALVAGIIWVATKTHWFQDMWHATWDFLKMVGHWFATDFAGFFVGAYHWIMNGITGVYLWIHGKIELIKAVAATMWDTAISAATHVYLWINGKINAIVGFVNSIPGRIAAGASNMWDGIKHSFRSVINWVIGAWDSLKFSVPSIDTHIPGVGVIGGFTLAVPQIPKLAHGGIVPATPGGRLVILGEGGQDEEVRPLGSGGSSGHDCSMTLTLNSSGSAVDDFIIEVIRRAVKAQGGNGRVLNIRTVSG